MLDYSVKYAKRILRLFKQPAILNECYLNIKNEESWRGRLSSTARKGIVGDWKNYFSNRHKEKFKEIAGDLLIN